MASAQELAAKADAAWKAGRLAEGAGLYGEAAEAHRTAGEEARWAHALRHRATIEVQMGEGRTALGTIAQVSIL